MPENISRTPINGTIKRRSGKRNGCCFLRTRHVNNFPVARLCMWDRNFPFAWLRQTVVCGLDSPRQLLPPVCLASDSARFFFLTEIYPRPRAESGRPAGRERPTEVLRPQPRLPKHVPTTTTEPVPSRPRMRLHTVSGGLLRAPEN